MTGGISWCMPRMPVLRWSKAPLMFAGLGPLSLGTWLLGWEGLAEEPGEMGGRERETDSMCVMCVASEVWL